MQRAESQPVVDEHGAIMFVCRACGIALTDDDFFALGLRMPERGESRDDYCDAELLDEISHLECIAAVTA